jgi:hypothetical protein
MRPTKLRLMDQRDGRDAILKNYFYRPFPWPGGGNHSKNRLALRPARRKRHFRHWNEEPHLGGWK